MNQLAIVERYSLATSGLEQSAVTRLHAAMDASLRNIESSLKAKYSAIALGGDSLLVTKQALVRMEQLKATLNLVTPQNSLELEQSFEQVLRLAGQSGASLSSSLISSYEPGITIRTADIAIEAATFAARDSVRRLSAHSASFREMATVTVTQGILQGWGVSKVARQLQTQVGIAKAKAEIIARTEILSATNTSAKANYRANGIEYGQVISTGDRRTCGLCSGRNLKVYRLEEISVPFHPCCRCFVMPYSPGWREEGLIDEDWERSYYKEGLADKITEGLSSFEKAVGLTAPPVPVWSVSD